MSTMNEQLKFIDLVLFGILCGSVAYMAKECAKEGTKNGYLKEEIEALRVDVKMLQELQPKQVMPSKTPENASLNAQTVVKGHLIKPNQLIIKQKENVRV